MWAASRTLRPPSQRGVVRGPHTLYRAAGFGRGYSSHSARRTFATRLLAQGHPIETVQLLLGHSHLDHVAPYLEVSKTARCHAMADLGGVFDED
ncbi:MULTISPECIES: tyrosine-type recombinase/integrase [Burkholderia]|uniref:tyrosine-type recombinase/integrase n=1 Tax=Burkholderia TaxID=32008 RepID=UPI0009EA829B|nr:MULTISPECIES: tyrosine-type recombinase/integrase [Burkholderia]